MMKQKSMPGSYHKYFRNFRCSKTRENYRMALISNQRLPCAEIPLIELFHHQQLMAPWKTNIGKSSVRSAIHSMPSDCRSFRRQHLDTRYILYICLCNKIEIKINNNTTATLSALTARTYVNTNSQIMHFLCVCANYFVLIVYKYIYKYCLFTFFTDAICGLWCDGWLWCWWQRATNYFTTILETTLVRDESLIN